MTAMTRPPRSEWDRAHTPLFDRDWSLAEIMLAGALLGRGITVGWFGGNTVSPWAHLSFVSDQMMGAVMVVAAVVWLVGVVLNGNAHRSPLMRYFGAGLGVLAYGVITYNFWQAGSVNATWLYGWLTFCQSLAFMKAKVDWTRRTIG